MTAAKAKQALFYVISTVSLSQPANSAFPLIKKYKPKNKHDDQNGPAMYLLAGLLVCVLRGKVSQLPQPIQCWKSDESALYYLDTTRR